jgi:hypothetical protein
MEDKMQEFGKVIKDRDDVGHQVIRMCMFVHICRAKACHMLTKSANGSDAVTFCILWRGLGYVEST